MLVVSSAALEEVIATHIMGRAKLHCPLKKI